MKNIYQNKLVRIIPFIFWSSLIFYLSSQNAVSVATEQQTDIGIHKLAHIIEYAILYLTFVLAFLNTKLLKLKIYLTALIFIGLYAISDEVHQSFNPTRSPRITDVFIDLFGGYVGYLLAKSILRFNK